MTCFAIDITGNPIHIGDRILYTDKQKYGRKYMIGTVTKFNVISRKNGFDIKPPEINTISMQVDIENGERLLNTYGKACKPRQCLLINKLKEVL